MKLQMTSLLAMVMFMTVSCSKDEGVTEIQELDYSIDLNLANETDWAMANEILELVNDYRASQGLAAIKRDQQHASAHAVDHTFYMIEKERISHDNFGIRSTALKNQGAASVGENVGYGYTTAAALVNAWINSPSHKSVMEGNYTHSGFGVIADERGTYYFTQLFYRK